MILQHGNYRRARDAQPLRGCGIHIDDLAILYDLKGMKLLANRVHSGEQLIPIRNNQHEFDFVANALTAKAP